MDSLILLTTKYSILYWKNMKKDIQKILNTLINMRHGDVILTLQ